MNGHQRHPISFWPTVNDQTEARAYRPDSFKVPNVYRSEENLHEKDFCIEKDYPKLNRK